MNKVVHFEIAADDLGRAEVDVTCHPEFISGSRFKRDSETSSE